MYVCIRDTYKSPNKECAFSKSENLPFGLWRKGRKVQILLLLYSISFYMIGRNDRSFVSAHKGGF